MDEDAGRAATIDGGRCRACGHVFAPFQAYGCERCGAAGDALEACGLASAGVVTGAASVHLHRQPTPPTPFGVAEVALDAGPLIRVLTEGPLRAGDRVARGPDGADGLPRFVAADDGMSVALGALRPVHVVGVGWHRYQSPGYTGFATMGLKAVRDALVDAGLDWSQVDESFIGAGRLGMAAGRHILRHLGEGGQPLVHIENASASGSAAFRQACITVAAGIADVALVLGVDKANPIHREPTGIEDFTGGAVTPPVHFALLTDEYVSRHGVRPEDIALVAVKNHGNGALNPNAHRQKVRSLDEVLASPRVAGDLTALQCCPVSEGAAAAIVASEEAVIRLGLDRGRAVRVASSASSSETPSASDREISIGTVSRALAQAGLTPADLDLLELHDAFAVEELHYAEATGLSPEGHYVPMLKEGAWAIGGRCAVSPSGGLLAMGHPIGPTGVGQIGEIVMQLRGEAGARQQPDAQAGLAHMVGLGAVCYAHVLRRG